MWKRSNDNVLTTLVVSILAYSCTFTFAYCKTHVAPAPLLVPMPRETRLTSGRGVLAATVPKVERVDDMPKEGYELSVTPNGVTIRASDDAGEFYARQTLAQLVDASSASIPCCEIKDSPRFGWRGVHVDDVRHFMGKEAVKRTIDEIARYKFNVFHWHLTDDQAWRLEMPEYPELTARLGSQFYTAADVREVVEYAAERHVTVVPEVEFPGHFSAARDAYPDFKCPVDGNPNALCVGNSNAVRFAEKALDRVCELFPSKVVHFGGDECSRWQWEVCSRCQELIKREGLSGVEAIQPWFTRHLTEYLVAKGRDAIGWDEIFDGVGGDLPKGTMGMCWRTGGIGGGAANGGHRIVRCPNSHCYFDASQGREDDPFSYWCQDNGWKTPIEKVYSFDPLDGVVPEAQTNVVGGQCCNWTEVTSTPAELEWKLWPRALALAEVLWTYPDPQKRDFDDFKRRAAVRRAEMAARGINASPLELDALPVELDEGDWIVESAATNRWTGRWSSPVKYDASGRAFVFDGVFTPYLASTGNIVTVETKAEFFAYARDDAPDATAQAAVRLSTNGCFQVWSGNGEQGTGNSWVDVEADGIMPVSGREYTIRTTFDYTAGTYAVEVKTGLTGYARLETKGNPVKTNFPLAFLTNCVSSIAFVGDTLLTSVCGDCRYEAIGFQPGEITVADATVILDAAKGAWLNACGEYAAISNRLANVTSNEFATAWLCNLDIMNAKASAKLSITRIDVASDNVTVGVTLERTGALAQKINGVLKFYGASTLAAFKSDTAEQISSRTLVDDDFSESDTATATFGKDGANFYRATIEEKP